MLFSGGFLVLCDLGRHNSYMSVMVPKVRITSSCIIPHIWAVSPISILIAIRKQILQSEAEVTLKVWQYRHDCNCIHTFHHSVCLPSSLSVSSLKWTLQYCMVRSLMLCFMQFMSLLPLSGLLRHSAEPLVALHHKTTPFRMLNGQVVPIPLKTEVSSWLKVGLSSVKLTCLWMQTCFCIYVCTYYSITV